MPQELHVVRCFSCQTFQVQIVKKIPKWKCNVCNEKQSLKKVYAQGSGKECREYVQQLNFINGQLQDNEINHKDHLSLEQRREDLSKDTNNHAASKWAVFLDNSNNKHLSSSEGEDEDVVGGASVKNQERALECVPQKVGTQGKAMNTQFYSNRYFPKEVAPKNDTTRIFKRKRSDLFESNNTDKPTKKNINEVHFYLQNTSAVSSLPNTDFMTKNLCQRDIPNQCSNMDFRTEKASKWEQFLHQDKKNDFLESFMNENANKSESQLKNMPENLYSIKRNFGSVDVLSFSATNNNCSRNILMPCNESLNSVKTQIEKKKTLQSLFDEESDVNLDNLLDL